MKPQPRPAGTAIVLDGVSKHYGEVHALDDVSLTVGQGEFFGVLGPNGAGKTTLVEIVEGMRKADSGTVSVFGLSPWPRDTALLRRIGVQTQTSAFFTRLTAWEHLETVAALQGADRTAARHALDLVGLAGKERSRVDDLSGGQRQRLALARAVARRPRLLVLDDATSSVDPSVEQRILAGLRESSAASTVVVVAYRRATIELADEVVFVEDGRVADRGSHAELLERCPGYRDLVTAYERAEVERQAEHAGDELSVETS